MVDWAELLQRDKLEPELRERVAQVMAEESETWSGEPSIAVTVVLAPQITLKDLKWELIGPIQRSIFDKVLAETTERWPYVRFLTTDDWQAEVAGDNGDDELDW